MPISTDLGTNRCGGREIELVVEHDVQQRICWQPHENHVKPNCECLKQTPDVEICAERVRVEVPLIDGDTEHVVKSFLAVQDSIREELLWLYGFHCELVSLAPGFVPRLIKQSGEISQRRRWMLQCINKMLNDCYREGRYHCRLKCLKPRCKGVLSIIY